MRTETINIYKFSELSEDAKQKALNDYEPFIDADLSDIVSVLKKGLNELNAELSNWSISALPDRGDFIKIKFPDHAENIEYTRLISYIYNNYYKLLYRPKQLGVYTKLGEDGIYKRFSKIQYIQTDCPISGICYDYDFLQPIYDFLGCPKNITLEELIQDCADNLIKAMHRQAEYLYSDKGKEEDIDSQGLEFHEDGTQY